MKKALLALALAAVLASSATAAGATSPTAYRAQVNGMCVRGIAALNAIPKPTTSAGLLPYFQKAVNASDKLLHQIAAVTSPASLKKPVASAIKLQGAFEAGLHDLIAELKTSSESETDGDCRRAEARQAECEGEQGVARSRPCQVLGLS